jgi:hypothetical protein
VPSPHTGELHLSVVATSRNDNHGGYLTHRMQHFVDGFVAQCRRHNLRAELLLVEWNPPADRKPLAEELKWPADLGPCEIRIVTVPREVHAQIPHGDKLPLFQMIAKNVGIRRARGRFVLVTNIDILFSDAVVQFMRDELREGCLYRADRYDVPTEVPDGVPFEQVLRFCEEKLFRVHATGFTLVKQPDGRWKPSSPLAAMLGIVWHRVEDRLGKLWDAVRGRLRFHDTARAEHDRRLGRVLLRRAWARLRRDASTAYRISRSGVRSVMRVLDWIYHALIRRELFTNACGDFTLMSKADWTTLRGYPEWPMYSWHLDSIILYQANRSAIREIYLGKHRPIYHIEHSPGSGFTPESADKLFQRLEALGIPYLDWAKDVEPMIKKMDRTRASGAKVTYNGEGWGYAGTRFADEYVGPRRKQAA